MNPLGQSGDALGHGSDSARLFAEALKTLREQDDVGSQLATALDVEAPATETLISALRYQTGSLKGKRKSKMITTMNKIRPVLEFARTVSDVAGEAASLVSFVE